MPKKIAQKKYFQKSIIYLSFFILLSIPVVIYGLAQDSFDTRNRAFEDLELSDEHQCLISLPSVNPYSLEVGKTVTIQLDAKLTDDSISELQIYEANGNIIYQETFENSPIDIATSFPFTPTVSGMIDILGIVKKGQGGSIGCEISSPYDIKGLRAVSNNASPEFISKPSESKPSQDIKTVVQYEYTLTASDTDGDRINYSYSFTPRADWLKPVIIEDGSNGKLTIKFRGSTDKAASYLANVFIHDGYSTHLRSQSWVISVSPNENDIPIIKIIDPVESLRINQGESFRTSWEANDLNHIARYELYITNNPSNEDEWKTIDKNIPYDTTFYNVGTSELNSGTYKIIAKAVDNQQPEAIGLAVSPEIVISKSTDTKPDEDDDVIISQPQVVNMSPSSTEDLSNKRVTIKATIIASKDATIDEKTIIFKLDDKDISESIKINKILPSEYTLIYQPEEDLDTGVHKAEILFSDSKGLDISKSWNFTIKDDSKISGETYNIFGYEVAKNIVLIVGVGVLAVILAIVAPFIIFSIWREDKQDTEYDSYKNDRLPASTPSDETKYVEEKEISTFREKVDSVPNQEEIGDDVWDKYSVAKPVVTEEQKEKDLEILKEEEPQPIAKELKQEDIPEIVEEKIIEEVPQPEAPETIQEPEIPEPEIPEAGDLEKIFQQIQQTKSEEQEEEPPIVKQ